MKHERQLAMCSGKERMPRKAAEDVAQQMRRRGRPVQAYRCKACGGWHIGSTETVRHGRRTRT